LPNADKGEQKTRLKTIRISESLARSLEEEAADEGTTVNGYINSALNQHLNWDKKTREFGVAEIPKSLLRRILQDCDDEKLARIGREVGPPLWKEMTEFWTQDSSPNGILDFQTKRARFNPNFQTYVTREKGEYTITMRHDFGRKWSVMTEGALQEFVKQSFHVEPRISVGGSVVTARFKVNPRNLST
jgi:hypothetical protein